MKIKKGFVFIETIVVVTILSISLIIVYRAFSSAINFEKRRINQDNAVYLYRTYYIVDFLKKNGSLKNFIEDFNTNSPIFTRIRCNSRLFTGNDSFCEKIINDWSTIGVGEIYLLKSNVSYLFETTNRAYLNNFKPLAIDYLKTINDDTVGYRIFIEFKENCNLLDGTEICDYHYASLKV